MASFRISAFADEASDKLEGQILALKRNGIGYIEPRNASGNNIEIAIMIIRLNNQ